MSRLLGPVLLFFGYTLVYAGIAHGGVFATDPWNGIFSDAYTDITLTGGSPPGSSTPATSPGSGGTAGTSGGVQRTNTVSGPPVTRRAGRVNNTPRNRAPAGGIGGASNSNFGGLVPGSLTGPDVNNPNSGGLLGAPPNFQLG